MKFKLNPDEVMRFALAGSYLVARTVSASIVIYDPDSGLQETALRQSDTVKMNGQRSIFIKNIDTVPAEIELQSSQLDIKTADSGAVSVTGGYLTGITQPVQAEIIGGIAVNATITDGSVIVKSPAYGAAVDMTIAAGQTIAAVPPAVLGTCQRVYIQNISDTDTVLRVGDGASTTSGLVLVGSIDNIQTLDIDTVSALSVCNTSAVSAKISVMIGGVA